MLEKKVLVVPITKELTLIVDNNNIETHLKNKDIVKRFFEQIEKKTVEVMDIDSAIKYVKENYKNNPEIYASLIKAKKISEGYR